MTGRTPEWSVDAIGDLTGTVVAITGANSGIGFEAAKVLASKGATIVMGCRNRQKGEAAQADLAANAPDANIELIELDMADLRSVRLFASKLSETFPTVDVLVNNAGIMAVPYDTTADGFERQLGTNHFGHFALTGLLLPTLLTSPAARVVTVSSIAHREGAIDFDNLQFDGGNGYSPWAAYRRSKLANLFFAYELDRRLRRGGHNVASIAVHPGVSNTGLFDHYKSSWWSRLAQPVVNLVLQGSDIGALPTVRAATDPDATGGQYYGPTKYRETTGPPKLTTSNQLSHDEDIARQLWEISEELTEISYLSR